MNTSNNITMIEAIQSGDFQLFLKAKHLGIDISFKDNNDNSLLHIAATNGQDRFVNELINIGFQPNTRNNLGCTPLHIAISQSNKLNFLETSKSLIRRGADIEATDNGDETPLLSAAAENQYNGVFFLLNANANPHAKCYYGWTALHHAARHGNLKMFEELINFGADKLVKDNYGKTPLDWAKQYNHQDILSIFAKNIDMSNTLSGARALSRGQ